MTEEEKDRTNMMKTMMIEHEEDELSIIESIEEFEDKIEYLDMEDKKKDKLKELCEKIKEESDESVQKSLFNLLQNELD